MIGKIILNRMIDIGCKTHSGDIFKGVIDALITAFAELIKKEFAGITVNTLKNNVTLFRSVFSDAKREATIPVAVSHCPDEQTVIRMVRKSLFD